MELINLGRAITAVVHDEMGENPSLIHTLTVVATVRVASKLRMTTESKAIKMATVREWEAQNSADYCNKKGRKRGPTPMGSESERGGGEGI